MFEKFKRKMKIKKELLKLDLTSFTDGIGWSEPVTFHCYLSLSPSLKYLLETPADVMECEYWKDENTCHYNIFEDKQCNDYKRNVDVSVFKVLDNLLIAKANQEK